MKGISWLMEEIYEFRMGWNRGTDLYIPPDWIRKSIEKNIKS